MIAEARTSERARGKGPSRRIEVFSAGCPVCREAAEEIRAAACESCEVRVLDLHEPSVARRARDLGVGAAPAVVVDGELASCCDTVGPDLQVLRAAGLGRPVD